MLKKKRALHATLRKLGVCGADGWFLAGGVECLSGNNKKYRGYRFATTTKRLQRRVEKYEEKKMLEIGGSLSTHNRRWGAMR